MTGVAGRATVLTEDAELLFGVTAGEAGGITAALTLLLAPLAPLAAPAVTQTNYQTYCCSQGKSFKEGTFSITRDSYLFWLPCICRSCQKSHPLFGSSPQSLHHRHRRRHWTTTPHPRLTTVHLCDIYRGKNYLMKLSDMCGSSGYILGKEMNITPMIGPFCLLTCWVSDSACLFPARTGLSGPWKSGRTQWIQVLCRSYPQCELWETWYPPEKRRNCRKSQKIHFQFHMYTFLY